MKLSLRSTFSIFGKLAVALVAAVALSVGSAHAAYTKIDNFEGYSIGNLGNQGHWHTVGTAANVQVVTDPLNSSNKCLDVNAAWSGCYNALASAIPANSIATIFFRGNFPGQYGGNSMVGMSKNNPPSGMSSGDGDLTAGVEYDGYNTTYVGAYNNATFNELFNSNGTWVEYWLVVNTTANTYTIYTNAAGPAVATGYAFQGGGTGTALPSFILGGLGSGVGNYYVDDIYIDYSGDNHTNDPWAATQPPLTPTNLTASRVGATVTLSWSNVPYASGYNVKRATASGGETQTGSTNVNTYTDAGLAIGFTYYYVVSATNAYGVSANSSEISITYAAVPTVATLPPSGIQATRATLGAQVTYTGGETPIVTIYYGTTDGGTTPGSWANSVLLGPQNGSATTVVTGLTPGTGYYFRAYAANSGGSAWSPSSASFTTLIGSLPALTNSPAIPQGTTATLGGVLTDVGNDNPVVSIYYGPTDGGTSPVVWAHNTVLGVRGLGAFSQQVGGLNIVSAYYFRCSASNIAGVAWAPNSTAFMTTSNLVMNLPATGVTFNRAVLNGSVLNTGSDAPTVTVFFGPTDGGTNAAAWDQSITLTGTQTGPFSQQIIVFGQGQTNYFTACAVNSSGTNWASPSLSYVPPLTYPVASGHYNNGLGITPAMGWSSWSAIRKNVSDSLMRAEADVMAAQLRSHGWVYVNMDDGWLIEPGTDCDAYGRFKVDSSKFPNGIKAVADYIHSKGLKFGIYYYPGLPHAAYDQNTPILGTSYHARDIVVTPLTDGTQNPPLNTYMIDVTKPGAQQYLQSCANLLASWGVDYVKLDWVNVTVNLTPNLNTDEVGSFSTALLPANSGRPMFLQFSNWLQVQPTYGTRVIATANAWRNNPDIEYFYGGANSGFGLPITDWTHVLGSGANGTGGTQRYAIGTDPNIAGLGAPGGWNDCDSLELGWSLANTGLSANEKQFMYSWWAITSSSMLLGCDLTSPDLAGDLPWLQNDEIIACDQSPYDPTYGHMANASLIYLFKQSIDGGYYVLLGNVQNPGNTGTVTVDFSGVLGLSGGQSVRNLFAQTNLGTLTSLSESLDGHQAMLFKIGGAPPSASFTANVTNGLAPLTVTFTDTSTGAVTSRSWNFGDGNTLDTALSSAQHTYNTGGAYTVRLIVSNPLGVSTNTKPNYVVVAPGSPPSLRAWLTFNNTLADATGNGHTGVFEGNAAYGTNVPNATAGPASLSLPNNSSSVAVSNPGDLSMNTGQAFTLACWFSGVTNSTDYPTMVIKQPASGWSCVTNNRAVLQVDPAGQLYYGVSCVGYVESSATVTNGLWHHGAVVYDGGSSYQLYVDGVADGTGTFAGCNEGTHGEAPWAFNLGYGFVGNIDEVAFWNEALTASQIQEVYTSGVGATLGQAPVASFSANVTSGTVPLNVTFTDSSSGTITNWFWNFGDGITLNTTSTSVPHTYTTAGSNTVTEIVSGPAGVSTNIKPNYIIVSPAPVLSPFQSWQLQYFGCTNCAQANPNADPLGKGMDNQNQFLAGLNPTNPASMFRILSEVPQGDDINVTWQTAGVRTNAVQVTTGGYSTNFTDLSGNILIPVVGDTTTNYLDVGGVTNGASRFYRIRLVP